MTRAESTGEEIVQNRDGKVGKAQTMKVLVALQKYLLDLALVTAVS